MSQNEKLKQAELELEIAKNHFNWAEKEFIDSAIQEYNFAVEKVNQLRKEFGMKLIEV